MHWHKAISELAGRGERYVVATVLATSGSAPRPAGTKMVVAGNAEHDTLGGGQLEHLVIARSRKLLERGSTTQHIEHFPLAAAALQCCGGSVTVLFECFAEPGLQVAVFGAGHIGARVVGLLEELGAGIRWIDDATKTPEGDLATDARTTLCERSMAPVETINTLAPNTHVVIVSHDHQLDYELLVTALRRGLDTFASVGVIGSHTKWERFSARLEQQGFGAEAINRIRCPLGTGSATDKQPTAIAIAIVAELLSLAGAAEQKAANESALTWRQVKSALVRATSETAQS